MKRASPSVAATFAIAAAAVFGMAFFTSLAPYNMDEFIHYDAIACHLYPGNSAYGTCDPFMLDFLGTGWVLPLRAYHYSGTFPAIYYLPLHLLFGSPLAARLLGRGGSGSGPSLARRDRSTGLHGGATARQHDSGTMGGFAIFQG